MPERRLAFLLRLGSAYSQLRTSLLAIVQRYRHVVGVDDALLLVGAVQQVFELRRSARIDGRGRRQHGSLDWPEDTSVEATFAQD
jgi:hypothetical protein